MAPAAQDVPEVGTDTQLERRFKMMAGEVACSMLQYSLAGLDVPSHADALFSGQQWTEPAEASEEASPQSTSLPSQSQSPATVSTRVATPSDPISLKSEHSQAGFDALLREAQGHERKQIERAGEDAYGRSVPASLNSVMSTLRIDPDAASSDNGSDFFVELVQHDHLHVRDAAFPKWHRHGHGCTYQHRYYEEEHGTFKVVNHIYTYYCSDS